jgi:hypothetical protein
MKLGSSPFDERFVFARLARDVTPDDNGGAEVSYQPLSSLHAVAMLPGENLGKATNSVVSVILRVPLKLFKIIFRLWVTHSCLKRRLLPGIA